MTVVLPAPFRWESGQIAATFAAAEVRFTTRRGGVSAAPYDSLNLGDHVADDPAAVRANRDTVAGELLGVPWSRVQTGRQVHGTRIASAPGADAADGQVTADAGRPVAVFGADCVTVALVAGGAVAALHAGWKGLEAGILTAGLQSLTGAGPVVAVIGPCARGCCYEVGGEVRVRFDRRHHRGRRLALEAIATQQLQDAGADAVHDTGLCTLCAPPGLLFSHRRDGGTTGRQAAFAWLV